MHCQIVNYLMGYIFYLMPGCPSNTTPKGVKVNMAHLRQCSPPRPSTRHVYSRFSGICRSTAEIVSGSDTDMRDAPCVRSIFQYKCAASANINYSHRLFIAALPCAVYYSTQFARSAWMCGCHWMGCARSLAIVMHAAIANR